MSADLKIIIPVRLNSSRLKQKVLAEINGLPMFIRVWQQAVKADVGEVIIAACSQQIVDIAASYGAKAVLTDPDLPSGTDRVAAAVKQLDLPPKRVILVQGDLPLLPPNYIKTLASLLNNDEVDYATLATKITDPEKVAILIG